MGWNNPYSKVYETLSDVLAMKALPRGGSASLYGASDSLAEMGDCERALLCGRASVALLCLEHAIRDANPVKQRRVLQNLGAILDEWISIPLAEAGIFNPRDLAA